MNAAQQALYPVLTQLYGEGRVDGRAPIIAVTSPHTGVGTSYVARNLAILAAGHYGPYGHRVALIDLDLSSQSQSAFFEDLNTQAEYGPVQGPYDATFGQQPFWQVSPDSLAASGHRQNEGLYCSLHMVGSTGLAYTKFQWAHVKAGQSVHIANVRDYWHAIREHFAVVFIDTPSFDQSDVALTVIPECDKTIIVNKDTAESDPENTNIAAKIKDVGGNCAGVVLNAGLAKATGWGHPHNG